MCGIAGLWNPSHETSRNDLLNLAGRMANAIRHRGPDDSGTWADEKAGVAFGFARLSILDLSPAGHQPMSSADGRFTIVFNGEIYNFAALRDQLLSLGHTFRGHSDTEVMLAAFCQWGIQATITRLNGMFAFAVWDARENTLTLVRDRIGIKPLYYGWCSGVFLFGSELKALRAHPAFSAEVDRGALALYLRHNYIPSPHSIYTGILKLPPGTSLTFSGLPGELPAPLAYWSARYVAESGASQPFTGDDAAAVSELDNLLRDSVRLRMIADVPLGAFLSGGVDSSTVVALMQAQSSRPVETFTIGFHEQDYNEALHARAIAAHLGTHHTELYVSPDQARQVIPLLPSLYDEPFSDSSQIPTFLVSQLARRHVTVSLSGDGGDELFGGYTRYLLTEKIWKRLRWLPLPARRLARRFMNTLSAEQWQRVLRPFNPLLPVSLRQTLLADKVTKFTDVLEARSPHAMYRTIVSHWRQAAVLVPGAVVPSTLLEDASLWPDLPDFLRWMMYMDLVTYLPDDILVKVDRASMGVSLEARVPLLDDHRVVEFAWRLPPSMKIRNGQGKWLLRQVLYQYVPKSLVERPKMGFAVPIDAWLRDPLRDWAEALLDESRLRREGFLDPAPIRARWLEHLAHQGNWQYYLWDVLMFQSWLEANP